ncbi:MAG TPA: NADH-quinone oxidoreductase subunit J [bacterium]|nr:NADH-quinone oxidoreductase subunit J [bacterium]HQL61362.1 NADH-quinone oxidoreductase subunit J [bacterium]
MMLNALYFWFFGTLAAVCGLGVVLSRHPMHSAISLVGTMIAIAALFLQLHSEFLAYAQIIVYTGAVMVLIVFTISLLNLRQTAGNPMCPSRWWGVVFVALLLLVFSAYQLIDKSHGFAGPARPSVPPDYGQVPTVARSLFTTYLFPFEFVAVLLTAAVIGATVLARQDPEQHPTEQEEQK